MARTSSSIALTCLLALSSHTILGGAKRAVAKYFAEPPEWSLVDDEAYCSSEFRKDLPDVTSVEGCFKAAFEDPDCGDELHTNGQLCRCVKLGHDCDYVESKAGSAVYRKVIRTVDVTWATNSPAWKEAEARCCCNKRKGWKDKFRRGFTGICVVVKGTDTCSGAAKGFDIDEIKRKVMHSHDDTEDEKCEIPEDHVQDIVDEFGPVGCSNTDHDEHGYKIDFTELGATAGVKCPKGQRPDVASVTCQSNGLFEPTPKCHDE